MVVVRRRFDYYEEMTGKTHQLVGFASVYCAALLTGYTDLNVQTLVVCFMLISLGSLTPDLDNEKSKIYTLVPVGQRTFAEVFEKVFGKHRSVSHSFLGISVLGYVSWVLFLAIPPENGLDVRAMWWAYMLAVVAHVGADMYTREGVPLLWPLKIDFYGIPIKPLRILTGSKAEFVLVEGGVVCLLIAMSYFYWDQVIRLFTF